MPQRIQRKRTKGWRMPDGAVYVGRPSKWGNPFVVDERQPVTNRQIAVELFRRQLMDMGAWCSIPPNRYPRRGVPVDMFVTRADVRRELRGKDLACWCPLDQPCHADVLLEIANQ